MFPAKDQESIFGYNLKNSYHFEDKHGMVLSLGFVSRGTSESLRKEKSFLADGASSNISNFTSCLGVD